MKNYKMIYLLIALICVGAALAAYHMSVYSLDKESLLKFKSKVDEQAWIIERDITFQFEQISDIASFFTVVDNITSEMFNAYITGEDFQRHVTTFNFGWLPRVPYSQKTEFELAVRKQGVLPDYYIFERSEGKAISVKVRDEYFPYLFRVAVGNSIGRVKGFDFASDPKRRKAIETARDTGKMTASEPIKLINDNSTVIQIYMPVYNGRPKTVEERRTQLRGVAFGSFLPKHILDANLVAREFFDKYAAYYIAVAGLPAEQGLLYRHAYAAALTKYSYTKPIEVSELHLLLTASPLPFFFSERRGWLPGFISLGTFIIFGLTGTIFIKMLLRRAIIENEVEKKTNELRATIEQMSALGRTIQESEKKYRELVELSMDGIWLADKDGATTFVNKSLTDMLGFSVDEMLGVNFLNFMDDDSKALAIKAVEKQVRTGERNQLEINYLHKNGSVVSVLVSASVILDDDGNHTAFFATITNITERKKLERTLAASEQKYRELVELSINGLWAIDNNGVTIFVNQTMAEMLGFSVEEMIGKNAFDFMSDEGRAAAIEAINIQKETGKQMLLENFFVHKSGHFVYVLISSSAIYDSDGNAAGAFATMVDITERKKLEQTLAASERKYRQLVELATEGVWMIDNDSITTYVNKAQADMLGFTVDEMIGRHFIEFVSDEDKAAAVNSVDIQKRTGEGNRLESYHKHKNGSIVVTLVCAVPYYDEKGNIAGTFAVISDITERKAMEDKLRKSLSEQQILLRELHHRVKNNLQVISGFVGLQLNHVEDDAAKSALTDTQSRIQSIALVHEELYQSEHLSEIDIKDYLQSLVRHLFHSFVVDMGKIDFRFEVESIAVGIDIAIPCGLIINELFTNCLKYAFKGKDRGEITIRLRMLDEQTLELIVADNGVGIPKEIEIGKTKSLGLKVVSVLTKQLKGQLELSRENGTTFSLRFKRSLSK